MMGYNHVSCGLIAGMATLPVAPVQGVAAQTAWVLSLGGASLLPDLDTPGSTAARMWGPSTRLLGAGVAAIARGHRQGTHDLVLAPLGFAGIVLLASLHPISTGLVLALMIGLSIRGLALAGAGRVGALTNLLISVGIAWWLVTHGAHEVQLLPLVVAGGVLVHIAGDWVTTEGIPVPVSWLFGSHRRLSLNLFKVNTSTERFLVAPALSLLGLLVLCGHLGIHDVDSLTSWCGSMLQHVLPSLA